ncbi:polyhydroxyalkanoate synthesis repressor PhaR [Paracoccus subflavus]|uniref:Polyhydroxyalkanoate synthesis repressor PhaR n=1 Tax=Paracoccus subflavus TaxID=2528244 RepID=A0A4Q9G1A3_9RHOB|nr:polyhydroxyalkanoate synthesis repressor PhaR [Paracoccus subflavus]TBN41064.1 polyhydroxyalkanoate synthesis repressor PhaR [Paracoccus subflavus]
MAAPSRPLLIKRYASRRLYNTETSDYVTLEDIASFIREGREVKIVDLKSGDDLTRQYLLQIIAEHEGRGENVLPIDVLTDLVRSYTTSAHSVVPQFLAASFQMLRDSQSKLMENMTAMPPPIAHIPGLDTLHRQQQAFLKAMMGGWTGSSGPEPEDLEVTGPRDAKSHRPQADGEGAEDMAEIRRQLAELQKRIAKL